MSKPARQAFSLFLIATTLCLTAQGAGAGVTIRVTFDRSVRSEPATGRLVVFLLKEGAHVESRSGRAPVPLDGPFWSDPQPMFGVDIRDLAPGAPAILDDSASAFPVALSRLEPGTYAAQARLMVMRTSSDWESDPGNLYSSRPVTITVEPGKDLTADVSLDSVVAPKPDVQTAGVEVFEMKSKLLSDFHGRDVKLRAGVRLPLDYDPSRSYAAVYEVPGFGGDYHGAFRDARMVGTAGADTIAGQLARAAFWIVLDPESENGHTLFANSANNGPRGDALTKELIPALEARYRLLTRPEARLLRGHSSGGWSVLWLALTYPETFGACWSSSPDPVDFRRFQRTDIYGAPGMYREADPDKAGAERDTPSYRVGLEPKMTVRQENLMEEVLGPRNTSGQQWDSWQAVFGPKGADGHPAALYDPVSGTIDHAIAGSYRAYDICELLRKNTGTLGLIFKQRIRLIVGDRDSFYLNEAVALLKQDVDKLSFFQLPEGDHGYIKIVPGADHGSIFRSSEGHDIAPQMLEHLKDRKAMPR